MCGFYNYRIGNFEGGFYGEDEPLSSDAVLCAVPIQAGDSYGVQFLCSNCNFPPNDTLTMDMRYCWNCGAKLDWQEYE